jgi:hypothetical protein
MSASVLLVITALAVAGCTANGNAGGRAPAEPGKAGAGSSATSAAVDAAPDATGAAGSVAPQSPGSATQAPDQGPVGTWKYTGYAVKPDGSRYQPQSGPLAYSPDWVVEFRGDGSFIDARGAAWSWSRASDAQLGMTSQQYGKVVMNYRLDGDTLLMMETTKPGPDLPELKRVQ